MSATEFPTDEEAAAIADEADQIAGEQGRQNGEE